MAEKKLPNIAIGFAPTISVAWKLQNNHVLWLALFILFDVRMVALWLQLPKTFNTDFGDDNSYVPEIEPSPTQVVDD